MSVTKYKVFLLEGEFCTDSDFHLDLENLELKEDGFDTYFEHEEGSECYYFELQTDDIFKVRDFLENLIAIYRCLRTHYYLIEELYDMTKAVLDMVFDEDEDYKYECISGNYDGTYISLSKFE